MFFQHDIERECLFVYPGVDTDTQGGISSDGDDRRGFLVRGVGVEIFDSGIF